MVCVLRREVGFGGFGFAGSILDLEEVAYVIPGWESYASGLKTTK
jgi:hypothetical protein